MLAFLFASGGLSAQLKQDFLPVEAEEGGGEVRKPKTVQVVAVSLDVRSVLYKLLLTQ